MMGRNKIIAAVLVGSLGCAHYADSQGETEEELRAQMSAIKQQISNAIHGDLASFLAGKSGQCQAKSLTNATASAIYWIGAVDSRVDLQDGAAWLLDVADAAAAHGCPDQAVSAYHYVIRTFIGAAYAAHRQRAEIGLADLRAAK